jgi:dTDP-glucose pyrophosphorylase
MNPDLFIRPMCEIKEALLSLNRTAMKVLFVVDAEGRLLGSLTDGDIRRALLRDASLDSPIKDVFNTKPFTLSEGEYSDAEVKDLFFRRKIELIPIVDETKKVIDIISWNDYFGEKKQEPYSGPRIDIPVVIMAGGKGTRLAPFTTVLPKPLIPIGDKTILELIMDEFTAYGANSFLITLNYRGEMIRAYLDCAGKSYPIQYLVEGDFYGTAGSLILAGPHVERTFIVSNCDIIVKADYAKVLAFHRRSGSCLTIVSSLQSHKLPYGVVDFKAGGEVQKITEKPELTFPINTGVYIVEKECLEYIPTNTVFHMTHLIETLLGAGKRVMTYPVGESEYIDIGQWDEYKRAAAALSGRGDEPRPS